MYASRPHSLASLLLMTLVYLGAIASPGWSQVIDNGFFRNQAVGGVHIDVAGILSEARTEDLAALRRALVENHTPAPEDMAVAVEFRKVSLRRLAAAIADARENHRGALPDEIQYLGGLQRIQRVLAYPEHNDIVLAGPGEGWTVDPSGNVVGRTTGRPVLHLNDLLVALRTASVARLHGISCSIDPTEEGRRRLESFLDRHRRFSPEVVRGASEALGMQKVTLTGVPADSRFARTMVAADYRMKRIAMKLEPAPIAGLPSYLDLIRSADGALAPRWWLACSYEPVLRSEDGLAFELQGPGVKVLAEEEHIGPDGRVQPTGRASAAAARFAELMTEHYEELSAAQPVFGDLRNLMDLCVMAALIEQHELRSRAGCPLPILYSAEQGASIRGWNAPKEIATQCSVVQRGRSYLITASGGVQIESWQASERQEASPGLSDVRRRAAPSGDRWWWN